MEREAKRQESDALATYGMLEGSDPRISPLCRALAVWGLTVDDIGVLSIHGTSTGANVRTYAQPRFYALKPPAGRK
jgi:fatty acid synthase subunit alpha, fungi type